MQLSNRRKPLRLTERGHIHFVLPVLAIALIAVIGGVVYMHLSSAASITKADYFESGITGKCLDDWHDGNTEGTTVDSYVCNKTAAQQWTLNKEINNTYMIENANGSCLDNWTAKKSNGNPIKMYKCNAKDNAQLWSATGNTLKNPMTGMCIEDPNSSTKNGAALELYACNGSKDQKWHPVQLSTSTTPPPSTPTSTPAPVPTPTPTPTPTSGSDSGFVTASGTNLMLNGSVVKFIGYDAYGMEGCWNGAGGSAWTDTQLDTYFGSLPTDGLTRIWAPESYGTSTLTNIVNQASKYHQHLVLSLGNDDGACDPTADDPGQSGEPLSFYQGGWKTQYVAWVNKVVPLFANNPTVAMWEIANEPGQSTSVPTSTMESYLSGAAAAIKAVGPKQLVESGFNDTANAGGSVADYEAVQSSPDLNVISFHDYSFDFEGKATLSGHFTDAQQAAKALNKPFIAGEVGVEAGASNCTAYLTQSQRVSYLETKTNDYLKGTGPNGTGSPAASAVMFWDYVPEGAGPTCSAYNYDITPSDPVVSMVQRYVAP